MSLSALQPARTSRLALAIASAIMGIGALMPPASAQDAAADSGWTFTAEQLATGVNYGYQLALDPVGRKVYFTDAQWRVENRAPDGTISVGATASGKVVVVDAATHAVIGSYDYSGLTRNDGSGPDTASFDWSAVTDPSVTSLASNRTTFSPYGIAVDGTTTDASGAVDPTIITTTARARDTALGYGGHVVVFSASQGGPTDADRIYQFEDGTPIFDGIRRVAVNTTTHKAYLTNFAESRTEGGERPGFIAVVDLPTRTVEARVRVPEMFGAIGVAVDEANNLIYVGSMTGGKLYVIDGSKVDTSDAQDLALNADAITELPAAVGENARPTYNAELERVYVAAYGDPAGTITVVDADPASAGYGTVLGSIETGTVNAVEVDGERGLLYAANLGDQEVVVYDAETLDELLRLPTRGNALNLGIDPVTRELWVSNFRDASFANVFTVYQPES